MNINEWVKEYRETQGAMLLDVRMPSEYAAGHIPGSVNVPLSELGRTQRQVPAYETPLYVYCTVGMRAQMAVEQLTGAGYVNAVNIGGIMDYAGELEQQR